MNLLVTYYKVLSMLYFAKSDYNLSYDWSVKALELIGPNTPDKYVKIHNQMQTSVLLQIYKLISHITFVIANIYLFFSLSSSFLLPFFVWLRTQ